MTAISSTLQAVYRKSAAGSQQDVVKTKSKDKASPLLPGQSDAGLKFKGIHLIGLNKESNGLAQSTTKMASTSRKSIDEVEPQ